MYAEKERLAQYPEKLLTLREASQHSGFTPQHLALLLRQGKLAGERVPTVMRNGFEWRISLRELERYLGVRRYNYIGRPRGHRREMFVDLYVMQENTVEL